MSAFEVYLTYENYRTLMNKRVENKRTNLGNIYFENIYTNKTIIVNANITSFTK